MIVHVDNFTQDLVNNYLSVYKLPSIIFNHEAVDSTNLKKPLGPSCLNVVLLYQPKKFESFSKQRYNLDSLDTVIFLSNPQIIDIFQTEQILGLDKAGRILVINVETSFNIYTICYYCGKKTGRMIFLKNLPFGESLSLPELETKHPFNDFNGHSIRVAFIDHFPYVYCRKKVVEGAAVVCKEGFGSELDLLKTLSETLNFTFQLIEVIEHQYSILFEQLKKGNFDLAIGGLSLTNERRKIVEFSNVIRFEDMVFMFIYKETFSSRLNKFGSNVALFRNVVTISTLLSALFIFVTLKKCDNYKNISFTKISLLLLGSTTEQPIVLGNLLKGRFKNSLYVALGSFFIYSMLTNMIFKSKMSAMLVTSTPKKITLSQLISKGFSPVVDNFVTKSYLDMFLNEEKPLINNRTTVIKKNVCEAFRYMETHRAVMIGETSRNLLHPKVYCKELYKEPFKSKEPITTIPFHYTPHAWPFKPGTPFVDVFSKHMKEIMSGGILKIWKERILFNAKLYVYSKKVLHQETTSVDFDNFLISVLYYSIAISICILIFISEIVYYNYQKRKRNY